MPEPHVLIRVTLAHGARIVVDVVGATGPVAVTLVNELEQEVEIFSDVPIIDQADLHSAQREHPEKES